MFVQVWGAAREVTGSCYLVQVGNVRFLVDCGMHQGGDKEWIENFEPFPFDPLSIDFVILTHAHIDHTGRLPRLVKEGYAKPIYATPPTCDLAEAMLLDCAYIQETEAEWHTRKAKRAGRAPVAPLYTQEDARRTLPLLRPLEYFQRRLLAPGVRALFYDAGHILGSAFLDLELEENGAKVQVLFTGDIGQPNQPIIRDPTPIESTDYLIMESTYGDRLHVNKGRAEERLAQVLEQAERSGGNVVIPAFAVGRTQELLYFLREIMNTRGLEMPVYVDSPLASRATEIYRRHREVFDEEAWALVNQPGGLFDFPQLHYTETADDSRALNDKNGIVIISASGMADAGRIRHHLKHNLWRPECHVVIAGFQAQGTLGRRLLDGAQTVRIFGEEIAVKAQIHDLTELSAHADQQQLLDWASHMRPPRLALLTHGEPAAAFTLAGLLEERLNFPVRVPELGDVLELK